MADTRRYVLFATEVIFEKANVERSKKINVLYPMSEDYVNRATLEHVQQQAQIRYFTQFDATRASNIKDVFIMAVMDLGVMTLEQFHEGYELPAEKLPTEPVN